MNDRLCIELPAWLRRETTSLAALLPTPEDRIRVVNRLADRNHREGTGGPFAAVVTESGTGRLVAAGVNLVLASGLSTTHAEVVAISLAQDRLQRWDLGADGARFELAVNWRPCVMCYRAVIWSGVRELLIAGEGPELEELTGFDEGPMAADWALELDRRGITVRRDVCRDEAIEVFRDYGARTDAIVYNARGPSRR